MLQLFITFHICTIMVLHPFHDKRKHVSGFFGKSFQRMNKFKIFSIGKFLIVFYVPDERQNILYDIFLLAANTEFNHKTVSDRFKF